MDVSLNFLNTWKWQPKYLEVVLFKTTVLRCWFWALISKALEKVLDLLHVLAVPAILKNSALNGEWNILEGILLHK